MVCVSVVITLGMAVTSKTHYVEVVRCFVYQPAVNAKP